MMKPEIGSEFWCGCTPLDGSGVTALLPAGMDTRYTLCGRTALELLLRDAMPIGSAYLPSYCCHTMIEPFVAKGIRVQFYDVFFTPTGIGWDFDENHCCDLVFLMDYFGFRNEHTIRLAQKQKAAGKMVIYDATHAMFCIDMDYRPYDYVFGSFRKWFGVNAGFCAKRGVWNDFAALSRNIPYAETRNAAFLRKQQYMAGHSINKQQFLDAFSQAEEALETDYIGYAPDAASMQILKTVNVDFIRQKRRENAALTIEQINTLGLDTVSSPYRQVKTGDCPLFVPLQVSPDRRADLRRLLIQNRVYLPIHWPVSALHEKIGGIYDTELSFVCDQRYGQQDMHRAIELIKEFLSYG